MEKHTLTARYGISMYDAEALAVHMYGTEEDKKRLTKERAEQFAARILTVLTDRLEKVINGN